MCCDHLCLLIHKVQMIFSADVHCFRHHDTRGKVSSVQPAVWGSVQSLCQVWGPVHLNQMIQNLKLDLHKQSYRNKREVGVNYVARFLAWTKVCEDCVHLTHQTKPLYRCVKTVHLIHQTKPLYRCVMTLERDRLIADSNQCLWSQCYSAISLSRLSVI